MEPEPLLLGYEFEGPRKIDLPEAALESLDIATFASAPLIYRLRTPSRTTFVGVREFSAPEGHVGMNSGLAKQLGLKIGDALAIERAELPKGTQVTLKTATDVIDWKSLLEAWLPRNCTALAVGDTLSIDYAGELHELHVVALAPESEAGAAVCVVDTDMDLIIEAEAALSSEAAAPVPALELNGTVELGPQLVAVSAPLPPDVKTLYVRCSEVAYIGPEHATSAESFLAVASAPFNDEPILVSTALLGSSFTVLGSGTLEVSTQGRAALRSAVPAAGEKLCTNCGKAIPEQSFLLHSSFCARNSVRCATCERTFFGVREVPSDHWHCARCNASGEGNIEFHNLRHAIYDSGGGDSGVNSCQCACGGFASDTRAELAFHKATTCALRHRICQFCHLLLPQGETTPVDEAQGFTGHESQCGNRTADCPLCRRPIRLRSLKLHLEGHEQQRRQRKPSQMCSNRNCPNVIRSADQSPALGLCAACFGPLSVPGANSDVSRVMARAERRYLIQMTRGCGKSWCQNQFCKTGSGVTRTVAESMAEVRRIQADSVHYFCVDEASTRKAMFVQLDDGVYDRAWRGMAISTCGTEAEASQWLEQNASRLNE